MQDNVIRWGILGCGKIAHKFAADMAHTQGAVIAACGSRDISKSRTFAETYGIPTYYGSYEALLSDDTVDVVYVATPHSHHENHAIDCLQANKHVLCEKPMGVNAHQVRHMANIASDKRLFLMEAMWTGLLPLTLAVRKTIQEGAIGEIRRITADFGFAFGYDANSRVYNPALAGGTLLDIGIYPLYITTVLLGNPEVIQSYVTKAATGTDSECSIHLRYGNGATAALFSAVTCHTPTECTISGTKGILRIPPRFHEQSRYSIEYSDGRYEEHHPGKLGYGYAHEIDHVRECLLEGRIESPVHPLAMTLELTRIMDDIRYTHGVIYPFEINTKEAEE